MSKLMPALALFILFFSCKKEKVKDLYGSITISGLVFDSTNRVGVANVPVLVYWPGAGPNTIDTIVDSTVTDANGRYFIKATIDISRFKDELPEVHAVIPDGYISWLDMEHKTVGATIGGYSENLNVPTLFFFQQANLTINLQRNANDSFDALYLLYNYGSRDYWQQINTYPIPGNKSVNVITAAGVPTEVRWEKTRSSVIIDTYKAPVTALPNVSNSITLPY